MPESIERKDESPIDPNLDAENKATQAALDADKAEAAKFVAGVPGVDLGKKEEPQSPPASNEGDNSKEPAGEKGDEDPETPPAPTDEGTPPSEAPSKDDAPKDPPTPPSEDDEPQGKSVPLPKYLDEKNAWKKDREALDAANERIKELELLVGKDDKGSPDLDSAVEAYAAKHGVSTDSVKELIELASKGVKTPDEKLVEKVEKSHQFTLLQEEREYFDKEFSDATPELQKTFPEMKPEHVEAMKAKLWELGHTTEFADKDLDYVIFKNKDKLQAVITPTKAPADDTPPAQPPKEGKRGIEHSKPGNGRPSVVTAKDFQGKEDFTALVNLPEEEQKRIVKDMDPETRLKFTTWASNQDQSVEVNRNGRIIKLKS